MKNITLYVIMVFMFLPVFGQLAFLYSGSPNNGLAPIGKGYWESVMLIGDTSEIRFYQVKDQEAMYDTLAKIRENGYQGLENKTVVAYYYPESPESYTFQITYFHDFSGKMENYGVVRNSKTMYTEGEYSWKSDTSVWIRMVNDEIHDTVAFTAFGNTRYKNDRTMKSQGVLKLNIE